LQKGAGGLGGYCKRPEGFFIQRVDLNAPALVLLRNEEHLGTAFPACLNRYVVCA